MACAIWCSSDAIDGLRPAPHDDHEAHSSEPGRDDRPPRPSAAGIVGAVDAAKGQPRHRRAGAGAVYRSRRCPYAPAHLGGGRPMGVYRLWLRMWVHDKVITCLEITQSRPFSAHKLDVLKGVFQVYQNYQSLLDYSERDALTGLF